MRERVHMSRVFRQKLVTVPFDLDHPYWVEDEYFDIENHIHHAALPEPRDWRQFCIQIARLHSVPLDRFRPLWDMHVIEGLDNVAGVPKGSYAILIKIHHAAIDGITAVEITKALHQENPTPQSEQDADAGKERSYKPGLVSMALRAWGKTITSPLKVSSTALKFVPKLPKVIIEGISANGDAPSLLTRPPKTRLGQNVSPHRVWDSRRLDLAEIKQIRQRVKGVTINDVILSICGGALRKYLQSHDDLPERSLIAAAPINVRTEKQRGTAGNEVSMMSMSLRTDIADPVERLKKVRDAAKGSKAIAKAIGTSELTELNKNIPGMLHMLFCRLVIDAKMGNKLSPWNTGVSNVPGPQKPLYMNGAKLLRFMPVGPALDGMGVVFGVISYNGGIEITLVGCRRIIPDPGFLADCVQDAFEELKASALEAPEPSVAEKCKAPAGAQKKPKAAPAKQKATPAKRTTRKAAKQKATPAKRTTRTAAKLKAAPAKRTTRKAAKLKGIAAKPTARRTKGVDKQ
jgi:WS/DGAT/MGAT family acyltransferase